MAVPYLKKIGSLLVVGLIVLVAGAWGAYRALELYGDTAGDMANTQSIFMEIQKGQSFGEVVKHLHHEKMIQNVSWFQLYARLRHYDRCIKAGEYEISGNMTPKRILEMFCSGRVVLHKLTIPEGLNLEEIAQLVETAGFGSAESFLSVVADPEILKVRGIPAKNLEGYLFPDTYHFAKSATPRKIVSTMLNRLDEVLPADWEAQAQKWRFNLHQLLTLASIIEKETGAPEERPLIASVFHNRLKKGMLLQTDPAVIYGVLDFNGNLTRKHLDTPSPYNTYLNKGLPPGPIASPGIEAIKAALQPAKTRFLYFVAKNDGTHQFSRNLRAHNRAVTKYQLRR